MPRRLGLLTLGVVIVILSLTGCGLKRNIEKKLGNKITEGILERVAGEGADVDLEEGSISFKDEEGSEISIGVSKWPKGKAIDLIPEFKHGKIISSVNTDTGSVITLEEVEEKDFEDYLEKIKSLGYTKDSTTSSMEEMVSYSATSEKDDSRIGLSYFADNKGMMITINIDE